jgi:hypothetical protein
MPSQCVERKNVLYCCCLCNCLHSNKEDMGICLSGDLENSGGMVTCYGLDETLNRNE